DFHVTGVQTCALPISVRRPCAGAAAVPLDAGGPVGIPAAVALIHGPEALPAPTGGLLAPLRFPVLVDPGAVRGAPPEAGCCNDHRHSGAGTGGPGGGRGADRRRPTRGEGAPPDPPSIRRRPRPARRCRVPEAAAAGRRGAPRPGRRAARPRRGTAGRARPPGAPP